MVVVRCRRCRRRWFSDAASSCRPCWRCRCRSSGQQGSRSLPPPHARATLPPDHCAGAAWAWARSAPGGGDDAAWRGITRDNNGRQQYWISLLYASLE